MTQKTIRNGIESSQTIGMMINAARAKGQNKKNRHNHRRTTSATIIIPLLRFLHRRLPRAKAVLQGGWRRWAGAGSRGKMISSALNLLAFPQLFARFHPLGA